MAKPILDQSVRVQQSLSELLFRAAKIGEQIQALEENSAKHILDLSHELDKSRKQSQKVVSLYDEKDFLKWNEDTLSLLNKNLLRISFQIQLYEDNLKSYESTLREINSEVAHV